jgi:hypothetical protein
MNIRIQGHLWCKMCKYIQRDATILSWFLFQDLYMIRALTMPIIRSTLLHRQSLV